LNGVHENNGLASLDRDDSLGLADGAIEPVVVQKKKRNSNLAKNNNVFKSSAQVLVFFKCKQISLKSNNKGYSCMI